MVNARSIEIALMLIALSCSYGYKVNVYFFYSKTCPHCHNVMASGILNKVRANVTMLPIDINIENYQLFSNITKHYNIPPGIPLAVVFIDNPYNGTVIQGDTPIAENLNKTVESFYKESEYGVISSSSSISLTSSFLHNILIVTLTGLADSVNPCIMSVLILLLSTLLSLKAKRRILKLGALYTLSVFLSYFVVGLILYIGAYAVLNAFSMTYVNFIIKVAVAIAIIIAGAINIKDFFFYGKGISFKLPKKYKGKVESLAKKASIVAVISLAILITLVEFPCSGMMYLGIVTYFASSHVPLISFLFYLTLYNIFFILPLILITVFVYKGVSIEFVEKGRLKYRKLFRLILGLALISLAILLLVM